ncbi:MAG: hypothetical protein R6X14_03990 [bacterium]
MRRHWQYILLAVSLLGNAVAAGAYALPRLWPKVSGPGWHRTRLWAVTPEAQRQLDSLQDLRVVNDLALGLARLDPAAGPEEFDRLAEEAGEIERGLFRVMYRSVRELPLVESAGLRRRYEESWREMMRLEQVLR